MDIKAANISWVPGIKSWIGYRAEDIEEEFRAVKILEKYGIHYEEGKFDTLLIEFRDFLFKTGGDDAFPGLKQEELKLFQNNVVEYIKVPGYKPIFGHLDYNSIFAKRVEFPDRIYNLFGSVELGLRQEVLFISMPTNSYYGGANMTAYIYYNALEDHFPLDDLVKMLSLLEKNILNSGALYQALMVAERRGLCIPLEQLAERTLNIDPYHLTSTVQLERWI